MSHKLKTYSKEIVSTIIAAVAALVTGNHIIVAIVLSSIVILLAVPTAKEVIEAGRPPVAIARQVGYSPSFFRRLTAALSNTLRYPAYAAIYLCLLFSLARLLIVGVDYYLSHFLGYPLS